MASSTPSSPRWRHEVFGGGGKHGGRQTEPRATHLGAATPGQRRSDQAAHDGADLHVAAGNVTESQLGPTPDRAEHPPPPLSRPGDSMKKTPLRRRNPLRLRQKRISKYRARARDFEYMAWIRRQPCAVRAEHRLTSPCAGRMEADHAGLRAMGQKADDRTCIPLCHKHHVQRTSMSGVFATFTKTTMRAWLDSQVTDHQHRYQERSREEDHQN